MKRSGGTRCHEEVGCGSSCRSGRHKKRTPSWRRRLLHLDLRASEVGEGRRRPDLVSGVAEDGVADEAVKRSCATRCHEERLGAAAPVDPVGTRKGHHLGEDDFSI
jgi:hypothetical protein